MLDDPDKIKRHQQIRYVSLKNAYNEYMHIHRDIRDFIAPRTARFEGEEVGKGKREDLNIINTAPPLAVRALPAGLQAGVTSPLRPWFRLGLPDPNLQEFPLVKEWLFEVESLMRLMMARSNLYDRLKSAYRTLGLYGTAAVFMDEDQEDFMRLHDYPIGSFYVGQNVSGRVDTMYRNVQLSCIQMMQKFPKDKIPAMIQTAYDRGDYETMYPLVHLIEPNRMFKAGNRLPKYKKFASVWLDMDKKGSDAFLLQNGYSVNPLMCPRWDVLGEDTWGYGCGEMALGDGKQVQLMEKRSLQILDQMARPTMVADSSLRTQRKTQLPGDTTYVNGLTASGNSGYRPAYQINNPYINDIDVKMQRIEARIDETFYKNLFLMVAEFADQPNITATQINTLREEKMMMLGPVLERLNDELLDPLIERVFNIGMDRGLFPDAPEEIQGMPLKVEYVSILAQAQKAMGIGNIERFVGFIGNMAQYDPTALNKLNVMEVIDEYAENVAVPPKLVRTTKEAQQITQQQQDDQRRAMAIEQAAQAGKAAESMGNIDLEGDTVAARMLEGMGMPQ